MLLKPFRSVLYIPGSNKRALDKAKTLDVDAIIFDLEDAVSIADKANARNILRAALDINEYGNRYKIIRINALNTSWGQDDLMALQSMKYDAVLLPKVNSITEVNTLSRLLRHKPIWTMMETPRGILNALSIADHSRVMGFVMGTNDLAKDINLRTKSDRLPLIFALQHCLMAARAAGVIVLDGVYNAFKDAEGLKQECCQGRDMGFDGKTLIHPSQIEITNQVFSPSEEEIDLAKRQIKAYEEAQEKGLGIAIVDGSIVENLHIVTAQSTLAKVAIIKKL